MTKENFYLSCANMCNWEVRSTGIKTPDGLFLDVHKILCNCDNGFYVREWEVCKKKALMHETVDHINQEFITKKRGFSIITGISSFILLKDGKLEHIENIKDGRTDEARENILFTYLSKKA